MNKKEKKVRVFDGNVPQNGELVLENSGWMLFLMGGGEFGWRGYKLVSKVPRAKANYRLNFNGDRFAKGKDLAILVEHCPEVEEWLLDELRGS